MALDGLNQLGKYLNKTRKAIDIALTRYHPHYPNIERSRDIFDRANSYQFFFRTKNRTTALLYLDFDVPPILSECKAGCIHSGCKSIAVTAGTNGLNLGESYKVGTLSVFLGDTKLSDSVVNQINPSAGDVVVTSGTGQLTICYVHDECSEFPCNQIRENCTTVASNIITFTSSSNSTGPFAMLSTGGSAISVLGSSSYILYSPTVQSGSLSFPGTPQLWYSSTGAQINRLSPYLNAWSVDVHIDVMPNPYVFDSFAEAGMGMAYTGSTDFHDGGRDVFAIALGQTTRMTQDFPTGVPYIFQKVGDYFDPNLTGAGTYTVVTPLTVGVSTDSIQAVGGAALLRTAGVSEYGIKVAYAPGATWNRSEFILKWDFSLSNMAGSNSVIFGAGNVQVEINTDGTITLSSSVAQQSYTKTLLAGSVYTLDIMYDLHQSRAQARVYPLGEPPPNWEVTVSTAGEYAGGPGYQPELFWEIHNVSGNSFILSLSKIYTTYSAIPNGDGTFPPTSDVINLNQISDVTQTQVLGDSNSSFYKQWHTDGHGFNYFVTFEEEAHDWNATGTPGHTFGQVGSPHAFGIFFGNGDIEYIHQQTASVVLPYFRNHVGLSDAWLDHYYIRVTGEYSFNTTGTSNELSDTGHAEASMLGSFQTFSFGDTQLTNATNYYILGGGDELYEQHNVSLEMQSTGWLPFSFRAHNEGTNGGISFGTGNGVPVDQAIFQWGVKIWNDPYEIRDTVGSVKNSGFVAAPGRGEISFKVRNVKLELVKHDGGIIIPIPECTYECV